MGVHRACADTTAILPATTIPRAHTARTVIVVAAILRSSVRHHEIHDDQPRRGRGRRAQVHENLARLGRGPVVQDAAEEEYGGGEGGRLRREEVVRWVGGWLVLGGQGRAGETGQGGVPWNDTCPLASAAGSSRSKN